jgi:UDP-glucose 4-epimerase
MDVAVVVGANGFLGSRLVNMLFEKQFQVIAVYNYSYQRINERVQKLTSEQLFDSNITPNFIFFVVGSYLDTHEKLIENNNLLLIYTKKFPDSKIIYISSTNVYGLHDNIISENSTYNNPSIYGLSKLSGEFIVSATKKYAIVRLTYIYGQGLTNNSFIPQIVKSAKTFKLITLFGDGSRKQDYIHLDDAASFCLFSARHKLNGIFLGATGVSISNKEVANEIAKNIECKIEYLGVESGHSFDFNPSESHKILNWKPKVTFSEGIKHFLK